MKPVSKKYFRYACTWLCSLTTAFLIIVAGCKKDNDSTDTSEGEGPFRVTKLSQLPDEIPYAKLAHGKICFQRFYESSSETETYIIDADKRISSGFILESPVKQANISPDGKRIACTLLNSSQANSVWNIYTMNIDGSDCISVYKTSQNTFYPTWSRDGSKIMFYTSNPGGALYSQSPVENASDRAELIKFQYSDDAAWEIQPSGGFSQSPAGNLISVSTSQSLNALIAIQPYAGKAGVKAIISPSDLAGGFLTYWIESAVFSPDATRIAFLALYMNPSEEWLGYGIYAADSDGANIECLQGSTGFNLNVTLPRRGSLCWSPDGTKILFTFSDTETSSHLYLIDLENPNKGEFVKVTNMSGAYDSEVSWSE